MCKKFANRNIKNNVKKMEIFDSNIFSEIISHLDLSSMNNLKQTCVYARNQINNNKNAILQNWIIRHYNSNALTLDVKSKNVVFQLSKIITDVLFIPKRQKYRHLLVPLINGELDFSLINSDKSIILDITISFLDYTKNECLKSDSKRVHEVLQMAFYLMVSLIIKIDLCSPQVVSLVHHTATQFDFKKCKNEFLNYKLKHSLFLMDLLSRMYI
jgi:hypothetical protein